MKKEIKQKIYDRITRSQDTSKVVQNNTSYLIKFFKRFDVNNDKVVTFKELKECLGPNHLDTGLTREEIKLLCEELDGDGNGVINVTEFVDAFHDGESKTEKSYNPIHEGKERQLLSLKRILAEPPKWLDPYAEVQYTFTPVTADTVLATPDFMHPPSLKPKLRPITVPPIKDKSTATKGSKTWFLKDWELGSPRQEIASMKMWNKQW